MLQALLQVRITSLLAPETWASPLLQQLPAYLSYALATGCSLIGEAEGLLTHAHTSVLSPGLHAVALTVSPGQARGRLKGVLPSLGLLALPPQSCGSSFPWAGSILKFVSQEIELEIVSLLQNRRGGAGQESGLTAGSLECEAPYRLAAAIINMEAFNRKMHYFQLLGKTVLINCHFSQQCLK